jgi:hypothetical protein
MKLIFDREKINAKLITRSVTYRNDETNSILAMFQKKNNVSTGPVEFVDEYSAELDKLIGETVDKMTAGKEVIQIVSIHKSIEDFESFSFFKADISILVKE